MSRILVITTMTSDTPDGEKTLVASHGYNTDTDAPVTLPPEHPSALGATFDPMLREWVINEPSPIQSPSRRSKP